MHEITFNFLNAFVTGQYSELDTLRPVILQILIQRKDVSFGLRYQVLKALTLDGIDLTQLEEIGPFLVDFLSILPHDQTIDFLAFLKKIAKSNWPKFKTSVQEDLIGAVCAISDGAQSVQILEKALSFFEAAISHGIPPSTMLKFLSTQSRIVNIEAVVKRVIGVCNKLLSDPRFTHFGMTTLCKILCLDQANINLLRFFFCLICTKTYEMIEVQFFCMVCLLGELTEFQIFVPAQF